MTDTIKIFIGLFASFLTIYGYIPYLRGILCGKTKPHLFTWLIWSLVTLLAALIQLVKGGQAGAWSTTIAGLLCCVVALLSVKYGHKDIRKSDWFFLLGSLAAIPLWIFMEDPSISALLITGIEICASFPTVRKSWHHPEQEVFSTYAINAFRFLLSILALASFSVSTLAYPIGMVLMNGLIASLLHFRRKK